MLSAAFLVALFLADGSVVEAGPAAQNSASFSSIWDGAFTRAQAARGKQQFDAHCASCHGLDLGGLEGKPLVGAPFWQAWGEDRLDSLFNYVRLRMPHGQAGSLDERSYLDIVAYILEANGYPSGSGELTVDRARAIRIVGREGPGPVPNFALVAVVGCLGERTRDAWTLTNASEPVRTRNPEPSADAERRAAEAMPPGTHSFELMDAYRADASLAGRRMEVKGLLIRGTPDRLNVTSMQPLDGRCAP